MTTTTTVAKIAVFLNTWGNYNENGADGGFWVNLPCDLEETLARLAKSTGEEPEEMEVFINDYDTEIDGLEIGEHTDLETLNELAEELENLDESDLEKIGAIMETDGSTLAEALENMDDYIYYSGMSLEEVAAELAEEYFEIHKVPAFLINHFDYESYARDLEFNGYTETTNGVIYQ